jgi:hypothetical protein
MSVGRGDPNKNCEATSVRNVSESLYNFQRYCDLSKDTSYCTLDPNFIRGVFQTIELANDQYYPVRLEMKFDCLGKFYIFMYFYDVHTVYKVNLKSNVSFFKESQYRNGSKSAYKLSFLSILVSALFFLFTKLF